MIGPSLRFRRTPAALVGAPDSRIWAVLRMVVCCPGALSCMKAKFDAHQALACDGQLSPKPRALPSDDCGFCRVSLSPGSVEPSPASSRLSSGKESKVCSSPPTPHCRPSTQDPPNSIRTQNNSPARTWRRPESGRYSTGTCVALRHI